MKKSNLNPAAYGLTVDEATRLVRLDFDVDFVRSYLHRGREMLACASPEA